MGLLIQNNEIQLTNASGGVKFTTAKRMPHLMYGLSGTINVANITGSRNYGSGTDYNGNPVYGYFGFNCDESQDFLLATNSAIQPANSFILPFFQFNADYFGTGTGVTSGSGSTILRLLINPDGYYCGAMILSPIVVGNSLILRVKTTAKNDSGGFASYPFVNDTGPTVQLSNTGLSINYRVYYGRFS